MMIGFKKSIRRAMRVLGKFSDTSLTYRQYDDAGSSYDPTTGVTSLSYTDYAMEGVIYSYTKEEEIKDDSVSRFDRKIMIDKIQLPFSPSTKDKVLIDSEEFEIVSHLGNYTQNIWLIQCRTTK